MTAAAWKGGQGKGFWRNTGYLAADTYSFSRLTPCVHPLFQPLWPMQVPVLLSQSPLGSGSSRALISSCVHAESMENHNLTMLRYSLSLLPWVTPGPELFCFVSKGQVQHLQTITDQNSPGVFLPAPCREYVPGQWNSEAETAGQSELQRCHWFSFATEVIVHFLSLILAAYLPRTHACVL